MNPTPTILMIRPEAFGYNPETASDNRFQQQPGFSAQEIQRRALQEFDAMVGRLQSEDIPLWISPERGVPGPDAVFANNWLSTAPGGNAFVYPVYSPVRRLEKKDELLHELKERFILDELQDWSEYEAEGRFLEGTGSMVMDHANKLIYAALSERTSPALLEKFAAANQYQAIVFLATDRNGNPVYHTNVLMSLGEEHAILCEDAIAEEWELIAVRQLLESTGHTILPITLDQLHAFAGNTLFLRNRKQEPLIVLSETALQSLDREQVEKWEAYGKLVPVSVPTIESVGGGSVRCMMTEIWLEPRFTEAP